MDGDHAVCFGDFGKTGAGGGLFEDEIFKRFVRIQ